MSLTKYIRERLADRRILLMTHLIAGYPSLDDNRRMLDIMAECGVDLVELQMPFSEPIADGPAFARASQLALESHITLDRYFSLVQHAAGAFEFPVLMMGYYNIVFRQGHQEFCQRLSQAGGVGMIIPDLPVEEYGDLLSVCGETGLSESS